MIKPGGIGFAGPAASLIIVQHWGEELKETLVSADEQTTAGNHRSLAFEKYSSTANGAGRQTPRTEPERDRCHEVRRSDSFRACQHHDHLCEKAEADHACVRVVDICGRANDRLIDTAAEKRLCLTPLLRVGKKFVDVGAVAGHSVRDASSRLPDESLRSGSR